MGIGFSAALSKYYSPTTLLHRSVVVIDIVTSQESYRMASDDNIVNKGKLVDGENYHMWRREAVHYSIFFLQQTRRPKICIKQLENIIDGVQSRLDSTRLDSAHKRTLWQLLLTFKLFLIVVNTSSFSFLITHTCFYSHCSLLLFWSCRGDRERINSVQSIAVEL